MFYRFVFIILAGSFFNSLAIADQPAYVQASQQMQQTTQFLIQQSTVANETQVIQQNLLHQQQQQLQQENMIAAEESYRRNVLPQQQEEAAEAQQAADEISQHDHLPDDVAGPFNDSNPQKPTVIPSRDDPQASPDDNSEPPTIKTVPEQERYAQDGVLVSPPAVSSK